MNTHNHKGNGQYYGRTLISPKLLEQIAEQQRILLSDPFYSETLKQKEFEYLFNESNVNSARLEADLMKGPLGAKAHNGRISSKILETESRAIYSRVLDAWKYGLSKFKGELTLPFLLELGQIIDPISNSRRVPRDVTARVCEDLSAINPVKLVSSQGIEGYLDKFIKEFNASRIFQTGTQCSCECITPVEKAVYSHFMTFYLQPLFDGNKRTGRVLQNLVLNAEHLPPPVIGVPENEEYTARMVDAFRARRIRDGNPIPNALISNEEHKLFDYLGRKILISLQSLNDRLSSNRTFYLDFGFKSIEPAKYFLIKNALTSLMNKRDESGIVRAIPGHKTLLVRGNLTPEAISAVLDSLQNIPDCRITPFQKSS